MSGNKSRWRHQKNGLPQGSVLAPLLFNIYTNDQPLLPNTKHFLYADDLALAAQTPTFEDAEQHLSAALESLDKYYSDNGLRPNPSKTQSCAFHLRNHSAYRTLKLSWCGIDILHCPKPKYLGITLDRSLTYRTHCQNTKMKVGSRNSILRRLTTTSWGAAPHVLRTTGLALSFTAGEYASPVWHHSAHAKEVDVALNETCRIISGCLKPTPLNMLYPLAGIAPPSVRREVACSVERQKQMEDKRHPLHGHHLPFGRLKSRRSFLRSTAPAASITELKRDLWVKQFPPPPDFSPPSESLPPGGGLDWVTWKSLNRFRTQVGRCRADLVKWGFREDPTCECGQAAQTMAHLMICPLSPVSCSAADLNRATEDAITMAKFWAAHI